ncbi:hypothetical protein [Borreliella valaisiana]|uniref:Uncharacterized protein n=1 Tax=Borreliella valaisiana VS116 TaxID=445987 RepID=C0R945_BORVA|nr:hypothetical protein [Borreliella valaisiana]ACN53030.1 conserved hypothetical protein [Borreliella valaisiana VS116]
MVKSKKIILNDRIIKNNYTISTIRSTKERNKKVLGLKIELKNRIEDGINNFNKKVKSISKNLQK